MNLGFGPMGMQDVDNVILRTEEYHDQVRRDKVFFEESAHLFIGDRLVAAFATWRVVNGTMYFISQSALRCQLFMDMGIGDIATFAQLLNAIPKARIVGQSEEKFR